MGCSCILVLLFVFGPRVLLIVWWCMHYAQGAPEMLWNVLGFIFMPCTLAAWIYINVNNGGEISGWYLVMFVFAIGCDIGGQGGTGALSRGRSG